MRRRLAQKAASPPRTRKSRSGRGPAHAKSVASALPPRPAWGHPTASNRVLPSRVTRSGSSKLPRSVTSSWGSMASASTGGVISAPLGGSVSGGGCSDGGAVVGGVLGNVVVVDVAPDAVVVVEEDDVGGRVDVEEDDVGGRVVVVDDDVGGRVDVEEDDVGGRVDVEEGRRWRQGRRCGRRRWRQGRRGRGRRWRQGRRCGRRWRQGRRCGRRRCGRAAFRWDLDQINIAAGEPDGLTVVGPVHARIRGRSAAVVVVRERRDDVSPGWHWENRTGVGAVTVGHNRTVRPDDGVLRNSVLNVRVQNGPVSVADRDPLLRRSGGPKCLKRRHRAEKQKTESDDDDDPFHRSRV